MFDLDKFNIKVVKEENNFGEFEIGPFPTGFGYTIGTPLRRILLASISGAAVTAVKISGVRHEYSTIPGVLDDVLTILIRIKKLAIISHSDEPQIIKLTAKGEKQVTANDITPTSEVEIINKDMFITELTDKNAKLEIEMTVEKGKSYVEADESRRSEVGVIPLDANFNPVKRVAMQIVKTRVGQITELDQIKYTIYTNGVILPSDALKTASEELMSITNRLVKITRGEIVEEIKKEAKQETKEESTDLDISNLNLSTRLENNLLRAGYKNLTELEGMGRTEVLEIKGMGQKSADELIEVMKNYKLKVKEN